MFQFNGFSISLNQGDTLRLYDQWPTPTVIISDGAYGVGGFPGDPKKAVSLPEWYRPHIERWSTLASSQTTLWFWGTELSWATVHPLLVEKGWVYKSANIWDKGIAHIAGNVNTQTLTHLPIVTEMCVQYTRETVWVNQGGVSVSVQEWLRHEWQRTGLAFSQTNTACGVANAASRKYFSHDHQWYFPPGDMMAKLAEYANRHGATDGRPYFDLTYQNADPNESYASTWNRIRAKFHCPMAVTNVWHEPAVRGKERIKDGCKAVHLNQKPLSLIRRIIEISSDPGDVVWDAFGGLYTSAVACYGLRRSCYSTELIPATYVTGVQRFETHIRPVETE